MDFLIYLAAVLLGFCLLLAAAAAYEAVVLFIGFALIEAIDDNVKEGKLYSFLMATTIAITTAAVAVPFIAAAVYNLR